MKESVVSHEYIYKYKGVTIFKLTNGGPEQNDIAGITVRAVLVISFHPQLIHHISLQLHHGIHRDGVRQL